MFYIVTSRKPMSWNVIKITKRLLKIKLQFSSYELLPYHAVTDFYLIAHKPRKMQSTVTIVGKFVVRAGYVLHVGCDKICLLGISYGRNAAERDKRHWVTA